MKPQKPKKLKKITLLIPCYNEAKGIKQVIKDIPKKKLEHLGYKTEIIVIDNNSTDNTAKIAKSLGAKVIHEPKQGKGNAIRTGFRSISKDTDFVVMLDGERSLLSNLLRFRKYSFRFGHFGLMLDGERSFLSNSLRLQKNLS